jgi:hypothetical protein
MALQQSYPLPIPSYAATVSPVQVAGGCNVGGGGCRLPAAAQLLSSKEAAAHGIVGPRRRPLLFVLTASLFAITVPIEIAYANEMWVSRNFLGIPYHYALTSIIMLVAMAEDAGNLLRILSRSRVLFLAVCLGMVVTVGFLRNGGNRHIVFADLYVIRWFFVGFVLMRLAIVSGSLRQYLVAAAVVILLTSLRIDSRNTMGGQIDTTMVRVSSVDLWPVINLGTIMLGLLMTVTWPRGVFFSTFCCSAFSLLILLGGIRTSTRSLFLTQTICFLLCLFALSRDPRMAGRGQGLRRAGVIVFLLAAVAMAGLVVTGRILGSVTQLGTRFSAEHSERYNTGGARIAEAVDMLSNMGMKDWLVGLGAGGMFFNTLGYWASTPHIAVLGWLLKGGIFIAVVAIWSLYIAPAIAFARCTASPRRGLVLTPPILIVGPALLSWAFLTFLSGGLDIGSFLGLGGLSALWMQLSDDEQRFEQTRRQRGPSRS